MEQIMANVSSSPKILKYISFCFLPVTIIVHIVSIATKDWYYQGDTMFGLFEIESGGSSARMTGTFLNKNKFYRFCQAGMILSLVLLILAQITSLAMVFKIGKSCQKKSCFLGLIILACLLTMITWIVFVAKISDDKDFESSGLEEFGYSFGLAVISTILSFVISIVSFKIDSQEERPLQRHGTPFAGGPTPGFLQGPKQVPGGPLYPRIPGDRGRSRSPVKGQAPPYTPYHNNEDGNRLPGPGQPRMSRRDENTARYDEVVVNPGYLDMP